MKSSPLPLAQNRTEIPSNLFFLYQWKWSGVPENQTNKIIPEWAKSNPYLLKLSNGCNLVLLSELYHGFISNMNIRSWVRILMVGSGRRSEDQRIQKRSYTIWVSWLFSLYTIDRFTMGGVLSNIAVWLTTSTTKLNHTIRNLRGLEVEKIENWQGSGTCTTLEIWKVRKRHSLVIYFLVLVMGF
jgi:hypothetical protein